MFADMEKLRCVWFLTLALLAALSAAQTGDIPIYFAIGKSLVLTPPKPVTGNIVWKHGFNLVAEWETGVPDYYGSFSGRSTLDIKTGRLEIKKTTKEDEGEYTVEIDRNVLNVRYVAKIPKEVPMPEVVPKPLSCSSREENCTFSCEGDTTGAGQVTYSWKMGEGEWMKGEKDINLIKTEVEHIKTITCQMENVASQRESKPKDNPFITEEKDDRVPVASLLVPLILVIVVAGVVGAGVKFGWWENIRQKWSPNGGNENNIPAGHNGETLDPLKSKEDSTQ